MLKIRLKAKMPVKKLSRTKKKRTGFQKRKKEQAFQKAKKGTEK